MRTNRINAKKSVEAAVLSILAAISMNSCQPPNSNADGKSPLAHVRVDFERNREYVSNFDSIITDLDNRMKQAQDKKDIVEQAKILDTYFAVHFQNGQLMKAHDYVNELLNIGDNTENLQIQAKANLDLGRWGNAMKNYSIAGRNYEDAVAKYRILKDTSGLISTLISTADNWCSSKQFDSAMVYLSRANILAEQINDNYSTARILAQQGKVSLQQYYSNLARPDNSLIGNAEKLCKDALMLNESVNSKLTNDIASSTLGQTYYYEATIEKNADRKKMLYDSAAKIIAQAIEFGRKSNNKEFVSQLEVMYANSLIQLGKVNTVKAFADSINASIKAFDSSYANFAKLYEIKAQIARVEGNIDDFIACQENVKLYQNSTPNNDQSFVNSLKLAKSLNTGERERAKGRERELKAKAQMQKIISLIVGVILLLIVALAVVIYRSLRRSKRLNNKISAQNDEIHAINEQVIKQNKEITGSINYASLIQTAIMPSTEKMNQIFGDHMLLYKAKDIVSGDFFWAYETPHHKLLAVCDCTGHGVPGAMLSMLGTNILEHATRRMSFNPKTAAEILDAARIEFKKTLNQTKYTAQGAKDSIDMGLIVYDKHLKTINYAGAFRPLIIIRDGEVLKYKPDAMPIGVYPIEKEHFKDHTIQLQENDHIYLFSDGICDQFGWGDRPMQASFSTTRLLNILKENYTRPFNEQKQLIEESVEAWRKAKIEGQEDCIQTDDNILIGLRAKNFIK